jgi:hypothetical protein
MKKFLIILTLLAMITSLVACNDNTIEESTPTDTTDVADTTVPTDTSADTTAGETTTARPTLEQRQQECREALSQVKISVLSSSVVPYNTAFINGYGAYSDKYAEATVVTLGLEFPENVYYKYYDGLEVAESTIMDGKEIRPETFSSAMWRSDDSCYILAIFRVGGVVQPETLRFVLEGFVDDVEVEKGLENNGKPIGFDTAKKAFARKDTRFGTDNDIIKLEGRHYMRIASSWTGSGSHSTDTVSWSSIDWVYALVPLEGGFQQTLQQSQVTLVMENTPAHTDCVWSVAPSHDVSFSGNTGICLTIRRVRLECETEEEEEAQGKQVSKDMKLMIQGIHMEIDDGDGNTVILKFDA